MGLRTDQETTLDLIHEALACFDDADIKLSTIIEKSIRIARRCGDFRNTLWLEEELISLDDKHARWRLEKEARRHLGDYEFEVLKDALTAEYMEERRIREWDPLAKRERTGKLYPRSLWDIERFVDEFKGKGSTTAEMNVLVESFVEVLERTGKRVHSFLSATERHLVERIVDAGDRGSATSSQTTRPVHIDGPPSSPEPEREVGTDTAAIPRGKRVFISYSHDSEEHKNSALHLVQALRGDGLIAMIDQYISGSPKEGWPLWMERQIENSDFVLVVCTETYLRRCKGEESPSVGRGATWESVLTRQLLYDSVPNNEKFIPVLFEGGTPEHIPTLLRGATHYRYPADYMNLLRHLLDQPAVIPHPIGEPPLLPPEAQEIDEHLEDEPITEREAKRVQFLSALYDETVESGSTVSMWELGERLGMDRNETSAIVEYLDGEGLLDEGYIGGLIELSHEGIKAVEEARKKSAHKVKGPHLRLRVWTHRHDKEELVLGVDKETGRVSDCFPLSSWYLILENDGTTTAKHPVVEIKFNGMHFGEDTFKGWVATRHETALGYNGYRWAPPDDVMVRPSFPERLPPLYLSGHEIECKEVSVEISYAADGVEKIVSTYPVKIMYQ